jgi:AraC-like DNA-binding protein
MPEPIRKLEDQLLDVLVHAGGSAAFQRRPPSDHCDVEALKAWLAARAHGPVRMTELSKRAGVSQRTVERSFLRTGCTPLEYLRGVRLEHARQMLVAATATTTVAEVARAGADFAAGAEVLAAGTRVAAARAAGALVVGAFVPAALAAGAGLVAADLAVDFGAGLGLEAADVFGDAVDGDLAMYSPTPRFERSRPGGSRPGANSVVSIRDDTGL